MQAEGHVTWSARDQESAIDYVLIQMSMNGSVTLIRNNFIAVSKNLFGKIWTIQNSAQIKSPTVFGYPLVIYTKFLNKVQIHLATFYRLNVWKDVLMNWGCLNQIQFQQLRFDQDLITLPTSAKFFVCISVSPPGITEKMAPYNRMSRVCWSLLYKFRSAIHW